MGLNENITLGFIERESQLQGPIVRQLKSRSWKTRSSQTSLLDSYKGTRTQQDPMVKQ